MPGKPDTDNVELIFVNAPTLNDHAEEGDGTPTIRSRLIRQLLKKKKLNSAKRLLVDKLVSDEFLNPAVFETNSSTCEKPSELVPCGVSSPRTMLSAARSDPFSPWNFELESYGNEVLDFCVREFWPTLRTNEYAELCYRRRFHQPSKLLLYSVLWATAVHLDFNRGVPTEATESAECQRYYELVLQALQEDLANTTPATVSDEALIGILYCAVNHKVRVRGARDPSPFTPPRTDIHHLDIFGTTTFHAMHWNALKELLHGRGGIQTIQMVTLPWLLSMADLLHAVGSLEKPTYPLLNPIGKPILYSSPCLAFNIPQAPRHFLRNGGFMQLGLLVPPVHQSIGEVFLGICEYSQCLDSNPERKSFDTHELGDCRDIVHHQLMNLPDEHDRIDLIIDPSRGASPEGYQLTRSIYLMVRYAVILYAIHVTFPLPRGLVLRRRLLGELSSYFTLMGNHFPQGVPLELFFWPAAIAAMAARDEPCRMQFMTIVQTLSREMGVQSWEEFRVLMQSFAWVDCACDQEGYIVWTKSQHVG
ncbi:hypothetical protein BJX99DRAFT_218154 [Aspergillus californicus]